MPLQAKVRLLKLNNDIKTPEYANVGDSGFDFFAMEKTKISYGIVTPVHTGLALQIECIGLKEINDPDPSSFAGHVNNDLFMKLFTYELQIRPKSGLAMKEGLTIVNAPGTIDSHYSGEIIVLMTRIIKGEYTFSIGDKIAQGIICPVIAAPQVIFEEVTKLSKRGRGVGGFGSTGK